MSDKKNNSIKTSDYGLTPYLDCYDTNEMRVKFNGGCLKQDRPTFLHGGIVNVIKKIIIKKIVIYLLMVQKFIYLNQKILKFLHLHYV